MDVKICGLCRPEDAALATKAGATYLGMILSPRGPRALDLAAAERVARERGQARLVGVFVDEPVATMVRAVERLALDVVQLHGDEAPDAVSVLRTRTAARIWKALRVHDRRTALRAIAHYAERVDGVLLDGHAGASYGGSGATFDWDLLRDVRSVLPAGVQLIVAGGLTPGNVAAAVAALHPDIVDVSSGVEVRVREKSPDRVHAFIAHAHGRIPQQER
jgi:phosphoribosylanthranilate isomerase